MLFQLMPTLCATNLLHFIFSAPWKYHRFHTAWLGFSLPLLRKIFAATNRKRGSDTTSFHWFSTTWPFSYNISRSIFPRYCYTEKPIQWASTLGRERKKKRDSWTLNSIKFVCTENSTFFYAIFFFFHHIFSFAFSSSSYFTGNRFLIISFVLIFLWQYNLILFVALDICTRHISVTGAWQRSSE